MSGFEYLLAVALLTGAPDAPEAVGAPELYAKVRPVLQQVAIQWEILDPREVRYVLVHDEDFFNDLNLLRRRYQELAGAPALNDCWRFPDRNTINELLSLNRNYRQRMDLRQPLELSRSGELRAAVQETDQLYQVWDTLRDARCEYYYVTVRRQALKKLRESIGDERYFTGTLPPCVPLWRFQPVD